jgi:hypothetical protein
VSLGIVSIGGGSFADLYGGLDGIASAIPLVLLGAALMAGSAPKSSLG